MNTNIGDDATAAVGAAGAAGSDDDGADDDRSGGGGDNDDGDYGNKDNASRVLSENEFKKQHDKK